MSYDGSTRSDISKLSSLSSEGRSSATTVLTLSSLRYLIGEAEGLDDKSKKLLGFSDNRQDVNTKLRCQFITCLLPLHRLQRYLRFKLS